MAYKLNLQALGIPLDNTGSDRWETRTGAYDAFVNKTQDDMILDVGLNQTTPYTIAGGLTPNVNIVANNGNPGLNITGLSSHGSGSFFDLGSLLFFNRSRGTASAPTALQNGDYIGGLVFGGYGSGDYQLTFTGLIAQSTDDWDTTPNSFRLYWMLGGTQIFYTDNTALTTVLQPFQFNTFTSINTDYSINNRLKINDAGTPSSTAEFMVTAATAARTPIIAQGFGSQVADIFQAQNDTGTNLFAISASGAAVWESDTNLYRSASNTLKTDDSLVIDGTGAVKEQLTVGNTDQTFTAQNYLIRSNNTYTLDFASALSPIGYDYGSTLIYNQDGYAFGSGIMFYGHPLIQNNSASTRTIGPWLGYSSQPTYQANGGSLTGQAIDFFAKDTFNRINSGTTSFSNHYQYWAAGGSVETGATVTNRYGFYFSEGGINTGTLTSEAAFVSATLGGTNKTHFLMGTSTIPSGSWGIYQSSTETNFFSGDINFVKETARTIQIQDTTTAATAGAALTILGAAGSNTTSGAGGAITITSGAGRQGNSAGGALNLNGGAGVGVTAGGAVNITGGGSLTGGAVTLNGGTGVTAGATNLATTRGALNLSRSGGTIGFWGATAAAQSTGWSVSNVSTDKSFDANATTINELADVLGTLIDTLKTYGILGA